MTDCTIRVASTRLSPGKEEMFQSEYKGIIVFGTLPLTTMAIYHGATLRQSGDLFVQIKYWSPGLTGRVIDWDMEIIVLHSLTPPSQTGTEQDNVCLSYQITSMTWTPPQIEPYIHSSLY